MASEGLHIYDKVGSPFWPDGFYPDPIPIPDQVRARSKLPPAFEHLEHVTVWNSTEHKAIGVKRPKGFEDRYIAFDSSCVFVQPRLPVSAISYLISQLVDENSSISSNPGGVCTGEKPSEKDRRYLSPWEMQLGNLDYSAILMPHEIETNLDRFFWENPDKSSSQVIQAILNPQRHHPDFQSDIGYRIAPIVNELAKRDLGDLHRNSAYKILMRMPHESMAAYVNDLTRIIEQVTDDLGCVDLRCPKDIKPKKGILSKLAQILNGAGSDAAPMLDRIELANQAAGGGIWASQYTIGGKLQAASCIGEMGPEMEKFITLYAYGNVHERDNNFRFIHTQALRMTRQSNKARQYIEDKLNWMIEKSKDPMLKPSWSKTKGLHRSIERAEKILEEWTDSEPYCPSRVSEFITW